MTDFMDFDDLESFARFVGVSGTDTDLFYEMYYEFDTEVWEHEFQEEEEFELVV